MENKNNQIVMLCFILIAGLIALVTSVLLDTLSAVTTGGFGRFVSDPTLSHVIPALVGFGVFLALQLNKKVVAWSDEVIAEIRRIVWPSRRDTVASTVVVCIMLLIAGMALGLLDVLSGSFIDWLLHRNFGGLLA